MIASLLFAAAAAFVGGAVNAMAGGGTLITFPTLLAVGLDPRIANATSTVAMWIGALGGAYGYRRELRSPDARLALMRLLPPAIVGAVLGAWLLLYTSTTAFERIAPVLVLVATLLFALQDRVRRFAGGLAPARSLRGRAATLLADLAIATYGSYFGAGMGILLLTVLAAAGLRDLKIANGVKMVVGFVVNGLGALIFAFSGVVDWPHALAMAAAALLGGFAGAALTRFIPSRYVRRAIVGCGLVVGGVLTAKLF